MVLLNSLIYSTSGAWFILEMRCVVPKTPAFRNERMSSAPESK